MLAVSSSVALLMPIHVRQCSYFSITPKRYVQPQERTVPPASHAAKLLAIVLSPYRFPTMYGGRLRFVLVFSESTWIRKVRCPAMLFNQVASLLHHASPLGLIDTSKVRGLAVSGCARDNHEIRQRREKNCVRYDSTRLLFRLFHLLRAL